MYQSVTCWCRPQRRRIRPGPSLAGEAEDHGGEGYRAGGHRVRLQVHRLPPCRFSWSFHSRKLSACIILSPYNFIQTTYIPVSSPKLTIFLFALWLLFILSVNFFLFVFVIIKEIYYLDVWVHIVRRLVINPCASSQFCFNFMTAH